MDNNSVLLCDVCSAFGCYVYVNFSVEVNVVKNTLVKCVPNETWHLEILRLYQAGT